jgi:hypothetical protein
MLTLMSLLTTPMQRSFIRWVAVENAKGQATGGFTAEARPWFEGTAPRIEEHFTSSKAVKGRDGRIISGIGFYGWHEGDRLHGVVLVNVPARNAENRYYAHPTDPSLHYEVAARFSLAPGEVKALGDIYAPLNFLKYRLRATTR